MTIRTIEILGSEALRTPAKPVESFDDELANLVRDMFDTMYDARGIGLAAPQIGVSSRVLVLDVASGDDEEDVEPFVLINPEVLERSDTTEKGSEGCLSIPGMEETVVRPEAVVVRGFDVDGSELEIQADGLLARALQHEIDHLDGILFIDHLSPLKRKLALKKWRKSQVEAASR